MLSFWIIPGLLQFSSSSSSSSSGSSSESSESSLSSTRVGSSDGLDRKHSRCRTRTPPWDRKGALDSSPAPVHTSSHTPDIAAINSASPNCPICHKSFKAALNLAEHLRRQHDRTRFPEAHELQLGLRWCSCETYWAIGDSFHRHFRPYAAERSRKHLDRCARLGVGLALSPTAPTSASSPALACAVSSPALVGPPPSGAPPSQAPRSLPAFSGPPSASFLPCFCVFCAACDCRGGACHCSCPPSCATCHSSRHRPSRPPPTPAPPPSLTLRDFSSLSLQDPATAPAAVSARVWKEIHFQFWPAWRGWVGLLPLSYLSSVPAL